MYQEFFSLKHLPFSISPDPDFLFLSDRHKEALAHLRYGLQSNGGFVLLTGEVGTGKTTICRMLLQELPEQLDIAFILNPALNEIELLATICDEFNIPYQQDNISLKVLFDSLTAWMKDNHYQGRKAVVLIDEAQHLSFAVLEQLRLLTNIESNNKKALQVILIGQTELQEKLKQNELRQLAQRITARYHLLTLSEQETQYYIQHRLNVAGAVYPIFEPRVQKIIFKQSMGVPRLINLICDRCLLCAYSKNTTKVTAQIVKTAIQEIDLDHHPEHGNSALKQWGRLTFFALLVLFTGVQLAKVFDTPFLMTIGTQGEAQGHADPAASEAITEQPQANNQLPEVKQTALLPLLTDQQQRTPPPEEVNEPLIPAIWFDDYPQLDFTQGEFAHALQSLYAIWGYQVDLANVSCEQGAVVSLLCFSELSNINKLKQLNHPAIIKLNNGEQYLYAVVYKLSDHFQLLIGEQSINVSQSWVERYWQGGLTLLWKAPSIEVQQIKIGEQGKRVFWLAQQLNRVYGQPLTNKTVFDQALQAQVKQFQRDNLLIDDGIVGARTIMLLMQKTHPSFPRLIAEK